ncbi:transport permease protein [Shewanella sp. NFH-SH190041]|uniref:ABC transporter permease n=1 Tax=Shewanella sp. NFH-SH190041 TaxID=2950245 RepID=UPI0021C2CEC3|nr:ABC transporter permease [Shewanella sp. NFH-SH190041]BDM65836.1 transport permease protein [Shewanella sp. NFH-SH190041]
MRGGNEVCQSYRRIRAIVIKELRQLRRDRLTFGMVVMIPLIQLLLFGYAINTDVRNIPIAVVDQSQSAIGRHIIEAIRNTQVVEIRQRNHNVHQAEDAITRGDIRAALILPPDLSRRLALGKPAGQWLIDGSDTLIAAAIIRLAELPLNSPLAPHGQPPALGLSPQAMSANFTMTLYYNPEQRAAVNTVPGLIAVILTMTMILFTSAAIVRERERGNLELLFTTPIRPLELMLGKILPYILVGLIQTGIILGLGHGIFDVPNHGQPAQLLIATLLFIAASLTLGLLISTLARTQLQAMQMTIFVLLPTILLSGFMFPFEAMPPPAQWLAELLPGTHFMRLVRGIVLRGASLGDLAGDALWLLGFTLAGVVLAAARFRKRLD